jgi:hypothetical protein
MTSPPALREDNGFAASGTRGDSGDAGSSQSQPAQRGAGGDGGDALAAQPRRLQHKTWASLSALRHAVGRHADALAAAERALRSDVFGRNRESILVRLFFAAFDAGRDAEARAWRVQ